MMLKKSQVEVLNVFRKDIFTSKSIRELSLLIKKDYPTVHRAVKELSKMKILKIKKVGKASICELSFSPDAISTLAFLDEQEAFPRKIPNMDKVLEFREFLEDIIIVTGSYAKGKETGKSDIDLAIITAGNAFNKQKLIETLASLFIPKIHPIVVTKKDFIDMLKDKKPNFGKEIFKNKLIFRNASLYYLLIKEAIENGFRG